MGMTRFIENLNEFIEALNVALENQDIEVIVSGAFDNRIYKTILDKVIDNSNVKDCKIIIPFINSSGIISRAYINKVYRSGGNFRVNSQFRKSFIVIGNQVFVLSFSTKYNSQEGIKSYFECCIQTEEPEIVEKICKSFMNKWEQSVPLVN